MISSLAVIIQDFKPEMGEIDVFDHHFYYLYIHILMIVIFIIIFDKNNSST
jgi:hypothetical protein